MMGTLLVAAGIGAGVYAATRPASGAAMSGVPDYMAQTISLIELNPELLKRADRTAPDGQGFTVWQVILEIKLWHASRPVDEIAAVNRWFRGLMSATGEDVFDLVGQYFAMLRKLRLGAPSMRERYRDQLVSLRRALESGRKANEAIELAVKHQGVAYKWVTMALNGRDP